MKNFGSISIKEKILIVCQVIAGERIQRVARRHKVSRPSVYAWTQKASDVLEQALKPGKRGPKFKKVKVDTKDKLIDEQKEKIGKLEDIISEKEKQIENLRGKINLQKNNLQMDITFTHGHLMHIPNDVIGEGCTLIAQKTKRYILFQEAYLNEKGISFMKRWKYKKYRFDRDYEGMFPGFIPKEKHIFAHPSKKGIRYGRYFFNK